LEGSGGGFKVGTAGGRVFVVMTDRKRMRRLPRVIAALSAGGLLVLVASCAAPAGEPSRGGPLDPFPPHGMFIADPVGHRFTDGLEILLLQGSQPARIIYCSNPNSPPECQKIADDRFPNG
jgi:hypothetical protein